jgi:DNA-directed RNA polymerase specialized sigma24 family protein
MIRPLRAPASHEDLFVARYARLLAWARQIVGGDRDVAEDLVHDAFVNISLSRPDLASLDNVDGYLYTTLRNLHLANVRRGARHGVTPISLVEYDSAAEALEALVPTSAHDELAAICYYACWRRSSSKVGSVLILRFFHGYRRVEVASLLRLSPDAVDNLLSIGRREARIWLQEPNRLRVLDRREHALPRTMGLVDSANPLRDLQTAIFRTNETACPPEADLRALYASQHQPLECLDLAHIVACQRCLDVVNETLGLPRLADRHADDGIESRKQPPRDPGAPRSGGGADRAAVGRHVQKVLRSQPAELRIAVNGQVVGGQHVSSARVSQHLLAQSTERLGFVEVLDERDARLFLMNVEPPPDGAVEQRASVRLSDDRELTVSVSFAGPWPSITLLYTGVAPDEAAEAVQACVAGNTPEPFLVWPRLRAWLRIPPRPMPRRVLVVLVALALIVALAGPRQAWSAAMQAGRSIVHWISDISSRPSTSPSRPGDEDARRAPRRDIALHAPVTVSVPAPAPAPTPRALSEAALLGLEVEILERLDRADALYSEDLSLTRPSKGHLRLEGMVDRRDRRGELMGALGALLNIPQFEVRLTVPEAAASSATVPAAPTVQVFEVARDRNAASDLVAAALTARGLTVSPEAMRDLAVRVLHASQRALRHAWAFKRLVRQMPADRLRAVHPDAYRTWRGLLNEHLRGFANHSADVRVELTSLGLLPALPNGPDDDASPPVTDMPERDAETLVMLAEQQDRDVRTLFAVAPDGAQTDVRKALDDLAARLHASALFAQPRLDR